jgi:hypothetical protein
MAVGSDSHSYWLKNLGRACSPVTPILFINGCYYHKNHRSLSLAVGSDPHSYWLSNLGRACSQFYSPVVDITISIMKLSLAFVSDPISDWLTNQWRAAQFYSSVVAITMIIIEASHWLLEATLTLIGWHLLIDRYNICTHLVLFTSKSTVPRRMPSSGKETHAEKNSGSIPLSYFLNP